MVLRDKQLLVFAGDWIGWLNTPAEPDERSLAARQTKWWDGVSRWYSMCAGGTKTQLQGWRWHYVNKQSSSGEKNLYIACWCIYKCHVSSECSGNKILKFTANNWMKAISICHKINADRLFTPAFSGNSTSHSLARQFPSNQTYALHTSGFLPVLFISLYFYWTHTGIGTVCVFV